jgi:hypothetical protein
MIRVFKSHAFVPMTNGTSSCESIALTIDTYHMNVAFNTISLGHGKKLVTKVNK